MPPYDCARQKQTHGSNACLILQTNLDPKLAIEFDVACVPLAGALVKHGAHGVRGRVKVQGHGALAVGSVLDAVEPEGICGRGECWVVCLGDDGGGDGNGGNDGSICSNGSNDSSIGDRGCC